MKVPLGAGSMFWILQPATHNDYDGYSIYTDPARYPHDPKPIQPIPSPTVCSGGNATDVRPLSSLYETLLHLRLSAIVCGRVTMSMLA